MPAFASQVTPHLSNNNKKHRPRRALSLTRAPIRAAASPTLQTISRLAKYNQLIFNTLQVYMQMASTMHLLYSRFCTSLFINQVSRSNNAERNGKRHHFRRG
jgi:hypothetical protein